MVLDFALAVDTVDDSVVFGVFLGDDADDGDDSDVDDLDVLGATDGGWRSEPKRHSLSS